MRDFKKLLVWEKAHKLTLDIYSISRSFPKEELYGITSQIRRAAVSIPTNIAEGCGKISEKEFTRFLSIAFGSASEVQYSLLLIKDLKYAEDSLISQLENQITEIKKMLFTYIEKIIHELKADC